MKRAILTAVAIALGVAAAPSHAQDNSQFHGMWNCNFTYTELDQYGNRKSGFVRYWQIQVNANNTYQVQGYTPGVYGNEPFQSQGQWKVEQGFFSANGPEYGPNILPGMQFMMGAQLQNGELTMRHEQKDANGQWVMNRMMSQCQRA